MQGIPISNIKETKDIVVQQQFDPSMGGNQVGCHGTSDYTIEQFFLQHKTCKK
jgi:hypothetical protein